jgi:hypothetical protein
MTRQAKTIQDLIRQDKTENTRQDKTRTRQENATRRKTTQHQHKTRQPTNQEDHPKADKSSKATMYLLSVKSFFALSFVSVFCVGVVLCYLALRCLVLSYQVLYGLGSWIFLSCRVLSCLVLCCVILSCCSTVLPLCVIYMDFLSSSDDDEKVRVICPRLRI